MANQITVTTPQGSIELSQLGIVLGWPVFVDSCQNTVEISETNVFGGEDRCIDTTS